MTKVDEELERLTKIVEMHGLLLEHLAATMKGFGASFRAEASRLDATKQNFTGWQAVQVSLRRIADALEAE